MILWRMEMGGMMPEKGDYDMDNNQQRDEDDGDGKYDDDDMWWKGRQDVGERKNGYEKIMSGIMIKMMILMIILMTIRKKTMVL